MSKRIIEIETVHAGQPRAYADAYYEAYITCRVEGTLMHGAQFYFILQEANVRILTKMWVRNFPDTPPHMLSPYLALCEPVEPTQAMRDIADTQWQPGPGTRWHVKVVEPYAD